MDALLKWQQQYAAIMKGVPPPVPEGELSPGDDSTAVTSPTKSARNRGFSMTLSMCAIALGAALGALLR